MDLSFCQDLIQGGCGRTKLGGNCSCAGGIGIYNCGQAKGFPLLLQVVIDTGVIAPEGARSNHRNVDGRVSGQGLRLQAVAWKHPILPAPGCKDTARPTSQSS